MGFPKGEKRSRDVLVEQAIAQPVRSGGFSRTASAESVGWGKTPSIVASDGIQRENKKEKPKQKAVDDSTRHFPLRSEAGIIDSLRVQVRREEKRRRGGE